MDYSDWRARHPAAAAELEGAVIGTQTLDPPESEGKSEAWAQQQVRFKAARLGWWTTRNNVGATPAACEACGAKLRPVRYGLANESAEMNKVTKSSDVIGVRPILIEPHHVGTTIGQFAAIEAKRPGWSFTGKGRESGQANFLSLITRLGGYATFSTGELKP